MSKELEALEKLCDVALCDCFTNELNRIANYKNIIETALKALEIIKECFELNGFDELIPNSKWFESKEKQDLLKEVLL